MKNLMNIRNKLFRKFRHCKNQTNKNKLHQDYKSIRNRIKDKISASKKNILMGILMTIKITLLKRGMVLKVGFVIFFYFTN